MRQVSLRSTSDFESPLLDLLLRPNSQLTKVALLSTGTPTKRPKASIEEKPAVRSKRTEKTEEAPRKSK